MLNSKNKLRTAVRQAINACKIRNGDVVLLRKGSSLANDVSMKHFGEALGRQGYEKCILAVVDSFDDLTVINEEQMQTLGWQRIPDHPVWQTQETQDA